MSEIFDPAFIVLRVWAYRHSTYGIHVAQCLETGSIVTADDYSVVEEMILELLEDEVSHAIQHWNMTNLFSSPAPFDYWLKYHDAEKNGAQVKVCNYQIRFGRMEIRILNHEQ